MVSHPKKTLSKHDRIKSDPHVFFGIPKASNLTRAGVLHAILESLLLEGQAVEGAYRQMVHAGIARRYQHALDLRDNSEAFAAWIKEPRICGLPRPPKRKEDICRALFRATYANPSDASKRYKRIEHLWKSGSPVSAVVSLLKARQLPKPPRSNEPEATDTQPCSPENEDAMGNGSGKEASLPPFEDRKPVRILGTPDHLVAAKKVGDFVAIGGYITSIKQNVIVLRDTYYG